ncbi:MAG: type II toxin-antitoxin system Phd/YefM family antitoxin [Anaerobutyricum soehngenii]
MIATKQMDLRANIKKYFDLAFNGETIVVSRKENKNVVVISEQEYNELQRAKRNAEYLAKLDRSFAQLKQGEVVISLWKNWSAWQMNDFTFTKEAFEDYLYWQIQDKKTMKRINTL